VSLHAEACLSMVSVCVAFCLLGVLSTVSVPRTRTLEIPSIPSLLYHNGHCVRVWTRSCRSTIVIPRPAVACDRPAVRGPEASSRSPVESACGAFTLRLALNELMLPERDCQYSNTPLMWIDTHSLSNSHHWHKAVTSQVFSFVS